MRKIVSILIMVTMCLPLYSQGAKNIVKAISKSKAISSRIAASNSRAISSRIVVSNSEAILNGLTKTEKPLLLSKPTSSFLISGGTMMQASTGSWGNLSIPQVSVHSISVPDSSVPLIILPPPNFEPTSKSRYWGVESSDAPIVIPDYSAVAELSFEGNRYVNIFSKGGFQRYASAMSLPSMDEFLAKYANSHWGGVGVHTAEAQMIRPRKLVLTNVEDWTDQLHVKREASGFRVNDKTVSSIGELIFDLEQRISNGDNLSGKTIIFEKLNDDHVHLIMDNVDQDIVSKGLATEFDVRRYDLSAIEFDNSRTAEGITIVKIPIKPQAARIAPDGETIEYLGKNIFKKIYHSFKMKSSSVGAFVKRIKSFVKGRKGAWDDFLFKQELEKSGINPDEIDEAFNYIIAQLIILTHSEDDVFTA